MDKERLEELEEESAHGVELFREPDGELRFERELEEAQGVAWIPELPPVSRQGKEEVMIAPRLRDLLDGASVDYEVTKHAEAYTAQEVAAAEHVPGWEVAKSVMLVTDGELVMVVLPAPLMVDLEKARLELGAADLRLAEEAEFSAVFSDCDRGAEPPFGNLYEVPTFVDASLQAERVTFNAGAHTGTVTMARADYMELAKPRVVDVATSR